MTTSSKPSDNSNNNKLSDKQRTEISKSKIQKSDYVFQFEETSTRYTITKSEQKIIIFLVLVICISLGVDYFKSKKRKEFYYSYIENSPKEISKSSNLTNKSPETKIMLSENSLSNSIPQTSQTKIDDTKININIASKDELASLHGIGELKADAIIEYRNTHGNFAKIEDIQKVHGIGKKTFEQMKDLLTAGDNLNIIKNDIGQNQNIMQDSFTSQPISLESQHKQETSQEAAASSYKAEKSNTPTPFSGKINLNTASKDELKLLENIGDVIAERIIIYRQTKGGFKNIEELKNVKGIGEKIYEKNKIFITVK